MIGQELKGPSHAQNLFTSLLGVLGGDEVEEPFKVGERSLGYFDRRHARALGRRALASGRTSPVAVDDVARVVATVLRNPAPHIGHIYELTGPRSVDMTELAAAFARALDRPVTYVNVPLDRWQAGLSRLGLPPHTEQHVATMAKLHRDNRYDRTADGVERVTGIPPQSIEAFVAARRDFYLA